MGDRLATNRHGPTEGIYCALSVRRDESPSNTVSPGLRSTSIPGGCLIHPTVWPQYTKVTDRTGRQRSDSIGRTVLQTVAQKAESVWQSYTENIYYVGDSNFLIILVSLHSRLDRVRTESNFRRKWPLTSVFGAVIRLDSMQVEFVCQSSEEEKCDVFG